jgi:hypothetical protein
VRNLTSSWRRPIMLMLLIVASPTACVETNPDTTPTWYSESGVAIRAPANWKRQAPFSFDLPELSLIRSNFGPRVALDLDVHSGVSSSSAAIEKLGKLQKVLTGGTGIVRSSFRGHEAIQFGWGGKTFELGKTRLSQSRMVLVLNVLTGTDWYEFFYEGHIEDAEFHLRQVLLSMGSLVPRQEQASRPGQRPSEAEILFHSAVVAANFGLAEPARRFVLEALKLSPNHAALRALESKLRDFDKSKGIPASDVPKWSSTDVADNPKK